MITRKSFLVQSAVFTTGATLLPSFTFAPSKVNVKKWGVQLYTFRDVLEKYAVGTLKKIAALGINEIESTGSDKSNYYGLEPTKKRFRHETGKWSCAFG